jgi:type VI secretion system protein ImpH
LLLREPFRFDFFQAVRLLERLARERAREDPRRPCAPPGQDGAPDRELVRFRALPSQSFPAAAVSQIRQPEERGRDAQSPPRPPEMVVTFLGLTGPLGVLPRHYTTLLLQRLRHKDYALRDFLDLFNHRTVSLFFRAWEKYRLPFAYERSQLDEAGEPDCCTQSLFGLVGLGTGGLRDRLAIEDETFLYYAGHFAHHPRCAVALEGLLEEYFAMPVRVEQARGQWLTLGEDDCSLLPDEDCPQGRNNQMGGSLVVGERVWDAQGGFRLRVGPLRYAQFRRFMPGGDGLKAIYELTRAYVGPEFDFDVLVLLEPGEVPEFALSCSEPETSHLGWNLWVRYGDFDHAVDDAAFSWDGD